MGLKKTAKDLKSHVNSLDLQMKELPSEGGDGDGSMIRFLDAFLSEKQRKKMAFAADPFSVPGHIGWGYMMFEFQQHLAGCVLSTFLVA